MPQDIKNVMLYQNPPTNAMIFTPPPIKSFVRRNGRLSPRQRHGLTECLSQYALPETPWDFSLYASPVIVEIGFGTGNTLIEMAQVNPQYHFIGIEVYQAGIGHVAAALQEKNMTNVQIAPFDAMIALQHCIPENSIQGLHIFFPDPWPKKRHHKRRLIQPAFMHLCVKKLKPKGFLHIATDWKDYANHIESVLQNTPELKPEGKTPLIRPRTKFEKRGIQLGHEIDEFIRIRS